MQASMHIEPRRFSDILVGTDFSIEAAAALERATELARQHGARITLVHAIETLPTTTVALDVQRQLTSSLEEVERIVSRADVPVTSRYEQGRPWEVIARVADEIGADLIVVGARGRGGTARLLLGSTADRVVRTASAPVLTLRRTAAGRVDQGLRTVLVGMDFSEEAALAAKTAADLLHAMPHETRMVMVHAWQPLVEYGFGTAEAPVVVSQLDDSEEQASVAIEEFAAPLRNDHLTVETVIRQGYAATVIKREAEALEADLIALGTHGRTGLQHFLMGSVAERVLHQAGCPILTVRHPTVSRALAAVSHAQVASGG